MKTTRVFAGVCKFALFICAFSLILAGIPGLAQEYRGQITGVVTDSSGAVVPGAKISATNTHTGTKVATASSGSGSYALLYLDPGNYQLLVEASGFSKLAREVEVRVEDTLKVDFSLKPGATEVTVMVEAKTPLLETGNADVGQTFERADIEALPLSDGNPFLLARLTAGAVFTGDPKFTREFDNSDVSSVRVNGAEGGNSFSLNGMPNTGFQTGVQNSVVAYIPPSDAVQEFKMVTSWFSATQGASSSSKINVSTKSGTNALHGTAYEFLQNEAFDATSWLINHLPECNGSNFLACRRRPVTRSNHFGGTLGGPVVIPKLYHGRDKTFFFVLGEGTIDKFPEPRTDTVPTLAMRGGDLSAICTAGFINGICGNANQQMYNPFTATPTSGGHVKRLPFLNNQIPANLLNPITQAYLNYYPAPNILNVPADGTPNHFSVNPRADHFYSYLVRIDHNISTTQRLTGSYVQNWREELRGNWAGTLNGIKPVGNDLQFINHGITLDDTVSFSPSTILDVRLSYGRFEDVRIAPSKGFDPATLGFSPAVTALFTGVSYLPQFTINNFSSLSGQNPQDGASNVYGLSPTLTKIQGPHLFTLGYEGVLYRLNFISTGNGEGQYQFNGDFARATDQVTNNQFGMGLVDFLVGQPTGGGIDRNTSRANQVLYHSAFIQDDWKLASKLTVNLGLRYEYEGAPTERFDRNVRGFDLTTPNPAQAAAQAAFANYLKSNNLTGVVVVPGQPAITGFNVLGGYTWVTPSHRSFWDSNRWNFLPRIGVAYSLTPKTVIRVGWGMYSEPFVSHYGGVAGNNQTGFSQTTGINATNNNGLTFLTNIANPFPLGVLSSSGTGLGLNQNVGSSASFFPVRIKTGRSQHWTLDIQRELPGRWTLDAAYVGTRAYDLDRGSNIVNAIPANYFSTSPIRDTVLNTELTTTVPNPFKGLFPGNTTGLNTSNTIQVQQLLRPFPQFNTISTTVFNGTSNFHALEVRATHRFDRGYSLNAVYTWSKLSERFGFDNDFQIVPDKQLSGNDIPQRIAITFIGEAPFGHGRRWGSKIPGLAECNRRWLAGPGRLPGPERITHRLREPRVLWRFQIPALQLRPSLGRDRNPNDRRQWLLSSHRPEWKSLEFPHSATFRPADSTRE